MFKVNKNTRWRRSGVSIVNSEHISHIFVSIIDFEQVNVIEENKCLNSATKTTDWYAKLVQKTSIEVIFRSVADFQHAFSSVDSKLIHCQLFEILKSLKSWKSPQYFCDLVN